MKKKYKAKVEYIEQVDGYIVLVLIDNKWSRCGAGNHSIEVWDFEEDAQAYIDGCDNLELQE